MPTASSTSSDALAAAPEKAQAPAPAVRVSASLPAVSPAAVASVVTAAPDPDPFAFLDVEDAGEGKKTPLPTAQASATPQPQVAAPAVASSEVAQPTPNQAGVAATAPASLFGSVAPVPVARTGAESGLSRLTGLPGLLHRYQGLKYVVAGGSIVVLVLAIVVITWSRDGNNKPNPAAQKDKATEQTTADVNEARAREEAERMFRATVGGRESAPQAQQPRRSGSRAQNKPAPIEPARLAQNETAKTPEQEAALRRFENSGTSPAVPRVAATPTHTVREVTQTQISAVVRDKNNQAGLKLCYERALKLGGQVHSGRVDVTVSIGASGVVKNVQVRAPVELSMVEGCIKNAVRRWAFPNSVEEYGTSFPVILQGS